ncbi:TetR/AcrR family transcriptional regulator [Lactobacillus corticis]|uniref:TetR family transcriptional regulator n=1 Tax=Lactobacillus corticis TaxID=2201249 RepID=A0A916QK66_9LACO|nr:TetR/AcrR family transcriptional regulator [Lactobacillus corticis]GFZ27387.1 TetR family transcriptional regulator [Lactobacillus corticis]
MTAARKKIQTAVIKLLTEKSIDQLKVTQICKLAGINRSTFYANYEDIYEMVDQLRQDIIDQYQEKIKEDRQKSFLNFLLEMANNPETYRLFFNLGLDQQLSVDKNFSEWMTYPANSSKLDKVFVRNAVRAVIKAWIDDGYQESPEEIFKLIYQKLQLLGMKISK